MKHVAAFLMAVIFLPKLSAQEQLGLRLETYAGVSSLGINPTGNLNNPLKWDANLAGGGIFIENNYAFLRETSLRRLLKYRSGANFVTAEDVEGTIADNSFVADFFNDGAKRFVNIAGFVAGPSLAVRMGKNHSVAVFTNLRSAAGSVNIPNEFSYYKYDARPFEEGFKIPKLRTALMNWSEIGLNYALKIPTADGSMNFGISLKSLQGYEAGYVESQSSYEHTKFQGNTITVGLPNGRFGYAAKSESMVFAERNGHGIGADLGFTYILQDHEEGYRFKFGASLLDLGYLKFDKNAQAHRIDLDSTITLHLNDYNNFYLPQDLQEVIETFSENSLGDSLATYEGSSFTMALPAALSIQADYGFAEHLYINALYVQRLPSTNITSSRGNMLALTPRWQHRWFSASVPVSVYNWTRVHVGIAARLGWLVIGSDNFAGIFFNKNFTGADFYFALKINPFEIGNRSEPMASRRSFGGKGKVKCYAF